MVGLFSLGFWMFPESPWNLCSICQVLNAGVTRIASDPEKPRWTAKLEWVCRKKQNDSCIVFGAFGSAVLLLGWTAIDSSYMTAAWRPIARDLISTWEITGSSLWKSHRWPMRSWPTRRIWVASNIRTEWQWEGTMRGFFVGCFLPTKFELCSPPGVMISGWRRAQGKGIKICQDKKTLPNHAKSLNRHEVADAVCFKHGQGFSGIEPGPGSTCQICSQVDLKGSKPDLILQGCKHHLTSGGRCWYA